MTDESCGAGVVPPLPARFLGIGVGEYSYDADDRLDQAVTDVEFLRAYLARHGYLATGLTNPDKAKALSCAEELKDTLPDGGSLVVLWSGHGIAPDGGLRLLTTESDPTSAMAGVAVSEIAGFCATSGASQILIVLDTCFSGAGVKAAVRACEVVLAAAPPESEYTRFGVLASAASDAVAYDRELSGRLTETGPLGVKPKPCPEVHLIDRGSQTLPWPEQWRPGPQHT